MSEPFITAAAVQSPRFGVPITVTIYEQASGRMLGVLTCSEDQLAANVPAGCGYVAGAHDPANRRVNVATKQVEPYQPPAPDADHAWNAEAERWELPAAVQSARVDRMLALREIELLEAQQARSLREVVLNRGNAATARKTLEDIDDQITALRSKLQP